ncbi:MAG: hypothetical protein HC898_06910 [Phycisphaerales bacterium]|nr:hypothetical protein [Phycisphaerales bacterium]
MMPAPISLFHAGGDAHAYGLMDETGKPRAGYRVFEDYLHLADRDGRKTAVTLKRSDGQPMQGVYVAAAKHEDGSMTLVINPSEVRGLDEPMPDGATQELHDRAGWEVFMGQGRFGDGHAYLTVGENQGYVGLARTMTMDLQHRPMLRVYVSHTQGPWELTFQGDDKKQTVLAKAGGASTVEVDLRKNLPKDTVKGRLTVRCFKDATVRYVSFAPDPIDTNQAIAHGVKMVNQYGWNCSFPGIVSKRQGGCVLRVNGMIFRSRCTNQAIRSMAL